MNATVVMYHGISPVPRMPADDPHSLFVTTEAFERQLRLLGPERAVDLSAWLGGVPSRSYLVTFDDAYRSVLDIGAPILARLGVPAVVFVPPGLVGRKGAPEDILDSDGLRALSSAGIELGVHGMDHHRLAGMTDAELRRQTADAAVALADVTGVRPRAFSYPNGSFDDRARAAVEAAGFEVAFSVDRDEGRFATARVGIYGRDSLAMVRTKLLLDRPRLRRVASRLRALRPSP